MLEWVSTTSTSDGPLKPEFWFAIHRFLNSIRSRVDHRPPFASTRHIPKADRDLRNGEWTKKALKGTELSGKRIDLIEFGRIAQELGVLRARLAWNCMRMIHICPMRLLWSKNCQLHSDVEDVFRKCTHIAIHCNLTDETHHLVNEHTLSLMPGIGADGIVCGNHLVSCARGGIINEDDALKI